MMVLIATVARKYFFGDFQVDGEIDVFQKFLASGIVVNEPFEMQYENWGEFVQVEAARCLYFFLGLGANIPEKGKIL